MASRSMNSRALGVMPARNTALTASHARAALSNGTSIRREALGLGSNRNTALVMMPSVPSLPTNRRVRSYPVAFFNVFAPVRITSPLASTTSRLRT